MPSTDSHARSIQKSQHLTQKTFDSRRVRRFRVEQDLQEHGYNCKIITWVVKANRTEDQS